jgi:hypothetical protein
MPARAERSVHADIEPKLKRVFDAFAALSAAEVRWLIGNPSAFEVGFDEPAASSAKTDRSVRTYLSKHAKAESRPTGNVVQFTAQQAQEARRLSMELLEARGIAAPLAALSELRGKRTDPFEGLDPEPTSDGEE